MNLIFLGSIIAIILFVFTLFSLTFLNKGKLRRTHVTIFLLFAVLFSVFAAIRDTDIPDTLNYIEIYKGSYVSQGSIEIGYLVLQKVHQFIFGKDYRSFFLMISMINFLVVYIAFTKMNLKYPLLAMGMYTALYGFYFNMIILRSGLAASFVLLAVVYMKDSKVSSILFYLIAISFHSAAIFVLPGLFVLLFKKRLSKKVFITLVAISLIVSILGLDAALYDLITPEWPIIGKYSSHSSLTKITRDPFRLTNFIYASFLIFFMFEARDKNSTYNRLLNFYLVGFVIYAFFSSNSIVGRLFDFYNIVCIVLFALSFEDYKDRKIILIMYYGIVFYSLVLRMFTFMNNM